MTKRILRVALAAATVLSLSMPAFADDRHHHHDYHHYHRGPYVAYGPGYGYAPPPVVYAPPTVVYAPPTVAVLPSLNVVIPFHVR